MTIAEQPPDLDWRDEAIPVSRRFDDPYFSLAGGLEETRHVFLFPFRFFFFQSLIYLPTEIISSPEPK